MWHLDREFAQDGGALLGRYTEPELALLRDFLRAARALQERHAARIASGDGPAGPCATAAT